MVLSPAKTLDFESPGRVRRPTQPVLQDDARQLVDQLRDYTPARLSKLMGISDKLARLNAERFRAWQPTMTRDNARPAIEAFQGDVYTGLDAATLDEDDLAFAQQHLRILSGLYGVLRPRDFMQPYRLEMGTALDNARGKDLYAFWGDRITRELNKQLKALHSDTLLNLASNEYFRAVRPSTLKARVVSPVFRDYKNGRYKVISFYAKKARGLMARWVITERVTDPAALSRFRAGGYRYSKTESTPDAPVFLRKP